MKSKKTIKHKKHLPTFNPKQITILKRERENRKAISSLWNERTSKAKIVSRGYASIGLEAVRFVLGKSGLKKGMIVKTIPFAIKEIQNLIYYPKPSEALRFILASEHKTAGDPGKFFPGSVGVIGLTQKDLLFGEAHVEYIQGCFNFKESPELTRSLATKHGGWRQHLLDYLFKELSSQKIRTITYSPLNRIQEMIFREVAVKNSFEVEASDQEFGKRIIYARSKET